MPALSLAAFLDWSVNTGPIFLSGPDRIINSVSQRSYILGEFLKGKPASETLQGGNKIRETLFLKPSNTFQYFQRNQDVSFSMPQKDVNVELDWRFGFDSIVWDEFEYLTQTTAAGNGNVKTMYKDMAKSKQQRTWQSIIDGIEGTATGGVGGIWYPPNGATTYAQMEGRGAQAVLPYSIPAFVHENGSNNGGFDSNWAAVETVDLATYGTYFDNQRVQYNFPDADDSMGLGHGLFDALEEAFMRINFKPPGLHNEHFEAESDFGPDNYLMPCSLKGAKLIKRVNRNSNANLITPQDGAHPHPRFMGVPFMEVAALTNAQLYPSSSATTFVEEDDSTVTNTGPRFYVLNTKYLKMIWHTGKYFDMHPKRDMQGKIGTFVIPVEVWHNLTCTSRRHQALIYPGAD